MSGILGIAKSIVSPITDIINKSVRDKDLAEKLNNKIEKQMIESFVKELNAKRDVLVAEIGSENWLASSWRPILMLSFTGIIVNNYILAPYLGAMFGFSITLDIPPDMWELLKIGIGGYIVGRSGEKITKAYKKKEG